MRIVLASASPRRKEILSMLTDMDFDIIPAKNEEVVPSGSGPDAVVIALSRAKAEEIAIQCNEDDVIIAADTIVWFNNTVYGKPKDRHDAVRMLRELSGNTHEVYTGITVIRGKTVLSEYEMTCVTFRGIDENEIKAYVECGEPMDKAGAYGAQGKGSMFVKEICGDFFNVMGLPVCRLCDMLKRQGVNLL